MALLKSSRLLPFFKQTRNLTTQNADIDVLFTNRNPRNLEKMRIGYKPDGYHVDKPGRSFWHKLYLTSSNRNVTAVIKHFQNGDVVKASTEEWAIKKSLYRTVDKSAFRNIGRILAQRSLESGITEVYCNITPPTPDGKVSEFLKALELEGLRLSEPPQFKKPFPWDKERPEKPWEITE